MIAITYHPITYKELTASIRKIYKEPNSDVGIWTDYVVDYFTIKNMLNKEKVDKSFIQLVLDRIDLHTRSSFVEQVYSKAVMECNDRGIAQLTVNNKNVLTMLVNFNYDYACRQRNEHHKVQIQMDKLFTDWADTDLTDDGKIQPLLYSKLSSD
jgi:hypothetical protein